MKITKFKDDSQSTRIGWKLSNEYVIKFHTKKNKRMAKDEWYNFQFNLYFQCGYMRDEDQQIVYAKCL